MFPRYSRSRRAVLIWPASLAMLGAGGCNWSRGQTEAHGAIADTREQAPVDASVPPSVRRLTGDSATQVRMRNVNFRLSDKIVLRIRTLAGEMRSSVAGGPIHFDDKSSFVIGIESAEVGISAEALTALLNDYVFAYPGAPLRRLDVSIENGHVIQKGVLRKAMSVPFEITSTVSVMPDGRIRLRPVKTRIMGIGTRGLMRALDIKLDDVLDLSKAKGVSVKDNDLYMDPDSLLPPPRIRGRVVAVRIEGNEMVQTFGGSARPAAAASKNEPGGNYMHYRGGTLRFGKLFMIDADMRIVDEDTSDAFDFSIDRYNDQLVAGYSVTLPSLGLEVHMPDLADVGKGRTKVAAAPSRSP